MLVLHDLDSGPIPSNLVPEVRVEDLDKRGEFELVRVLLPPLQKLTAEEGQAEVTKLLGPQGSVVVLPKSRQISITETAGKLRTICRVIEAIENPLGALQFRVYPITSADPDAVFKVMQTLLANDPDARLAQDPKTGSLYLLARPSQHATVKEVLDGMQLDGGAKLDVIQLRIVDPQQAVLSIKNLFGTTSGTNGPKVDADTNNKQLMVRGTDAQILQIRGLLEKMGERLSDGGAAGGPNVRVLPHSRQLQRAIEQAKEIFLLTHPGTTFREVTPSSALPRRNRTIPSSTRPHPEKRPRRKEMVCRRMSRERPNRWNNICECTRVAGRTSRPRPRDRTSIHRRLPRRLDQSPLPGKAPNQDPRLPSVRRRALALGPRRRSATQPELSQFPNRGKLRPRERAAIGRYLPLPRMRRRQRPKRIPNRDRSRAPNCPNRMQRRNPRVLQPLDRGGRFPLPESAASGGGQRGFQTRIQTGLQITPAGGSQEIRDQRVFWTQ